MSVTVTVSTLFLCNDHTTTQGTLFVSVTVTVSTYEMTTQLPTHSSKGNLVKHVVVPMFDAIYISTFYALSRGVIHKIVPRAQMGQNSL